MKNPHDNEEHGDEDVNFEPLPDRQAGEEELGDLGAAQAKLKKLKDELAKVKAERQEYLDGWQRCKADAVNARKEALTNADRAASRIKEQLIEDIIPVLDGFDMAAGSAAWEAIDPQWRGGIERIRNQLLDTLGRHGVERYGNVGELFDHAEHEAVEDRADVEGESGAIAKILRYGYKMNGRVLRPAQVIVRK